MPKNNKNIEALIVKYFSKSATASELAKLEEWLQVTSNTHIFANFVKTNYLIDYSMLDFDTEKEIKEVLQKIENKENHIRKFNFKGSILKYAAILLIGLTAGYLYMDKPISPSQKASKVTVEKETVIKVGTDKAILTLENGSDVVLQKGESVQLKGLTNSGEKLIYEANGKKTSNPNKIKYNQLTIPRGGQFFVQLSDSTKVWLNSDSKLKYPVQFIKGQPRQVELIHGEAYFDVSKSLDHNGDSFKVLTGSQEIEVSGTEFNIEAYHDETDMVTTLVEGKVTIKNGDEKIKLKPSQQSIINSESEHIVVKKVDKLFDVIAWKEGYFNFKNKSMKDIMKVLSRWYDIDYVFEDLGKETKSFSGVLDRENEVGEILKYIQKTNEITFRIENRTVMIK